jgi:hypothetical protein
MAELISIREYARRRGVSHTSVLKAIKRGRIKLTRGKLDPVVADAAWETNTDPAQRRPTRGAKDGRSGTNGTPKRTPEGVTYAKSRAQREIYLARLAELEYDVKKGKLVDADEVRARVFTIARTARDILIGMPDRLAPRIVGETNQHEIHRMIAEEVARVCNEIASARGL